MEGGSGSERRRLLVLGAGAGQLGLLEAAQERGVYVVAVDRDPAAPGFRFADRRAIVSVEDENAVDRLAAAEQVDGIIAPGIDFPVGLAARVAARHNLRHPLSPEVAQAAVSKLRQRERLVEAGVPHAPFRVCTTRRRRAGGRRARPSVVIKPPDRQGQRGLTVVTAAEDVAEAFETALAAARGQIVLVDKLVAGPELTVNAFSVGGDFHPLTVTDRVVAAPPAFGVALAHVWPSELDAARSSMRPSSSHGRRRKAVGVQDGPTYTQVLVGEDGPVVGELAARLGGGHDAELCEAALGVDLNGAGDRRRARRRDSG